MSTLSTLNVPIQINRGNSAPNQNNLLEGEPYFDLSTQTLYISNGSSVNINVSSSNSTSRLAQKSNTDIFSFNSENTYCYIGGLHVSVDSNLNYELSSQSRRNVTLDGVYLSDQRVVTLRSGEMYGNSFPANPKVGQLFFKFA